jgi:hypothetical protein
MANRYAIANGNFNNTATWSTTPAGVGGASVPTIGDDAFANNRTVTVNVDSACDNVVVGAIAGATAGGTFTLNNGVTLTANVTGSGTTSNFVTFGGSVGNFANLIGNIAHSTINNTANIVNNTSTGTLNITGNIIGGSVANSGNGTGSVGGNGIINIVGNVIGGAGTTTQGVVLQAGSVGIITITGNVSGGPSSNAFGILNRSTGTIIINGTVFAGTGASGASNISTGVISATRVVGNSFGLGSVGIVSQAAIDNVQNGRVYVEQVEFGPRGQTPISGPVYIIPSNRNTLTGVLTALGNTVTFYNTLSVSGLIPPVSSVQLGTVYNVGNSVGTMAVPSASAVEFGVPVDNTVGVAVLTPQTVWGYSRLSATDVGSMGDRLRNAATTQSVGSQIASFNL